VAGAPLNIEEVALDKPDDVNVIVGQAHFIETVEDLPEALVREGFAVNVLNPVKSVPEVCTIFCATANPVDVLVAVTSRSRGIIGVIDGSPPVGVETQADAATRHRLLRDIGYKL
jgi:uncharacterized protein